MMNIKQKYEAIVLSAGKGTRMCSDIPKQYMQLKDKPVLYYSLKAFEESLIDDIIIVVGNGDVDYVKKEIVEKYAFKKVRSIVEGGAYRFDSVYNGLLASVSDTTYVMIHDGARPVLTNSIITTLAAEVQQKKAVVAACHVKDTIKVAKPDGKVTATPDRSTLWQVQTPQVFDYALVKDAYTQLKAAGDLTATDDAMVVEKYTGEPVYLIDTGYKNIKITTPEDLELAELFLE
jgi:2-C-methyl-D-erythritol 4-phosphate cytidylyltransferase